MSRAIKYIKRYCLEIVEFKKIDLNTLYCQYRSGIDHEDMKIINSPHYELASLYYKNGLSWLKENYDITKYYLFQKHILKKDPTVPMRKINLFDSIKKGYLRKGHEKEYIVILTEPLISSRYGLKNASMRRPEIFVGHHRAGALLALGESPVEVIIAKDAEPLTRKCNGKIHDIYKEIKWNI